MTKIKEKLLHILPAYGWKLLITMLSFNLLVYIGTRFFNSSWHHYDMTTFIDHLIPFIKEWVVIYVVVAYGQWIIGYYMIAREDYEVCAPICIAEMIAKTLCLICFLAIPTTMVRATITGHDFFSECTRLVYTIDAADNLFPSIHVLESYVIARTAFRLKKAPQAYPFITIVISILVALSTVFLKQHVVLDAVGAIVAYEIGLFIVKRIKLPYHS